MRYKVLKTFQLSRDGFTSERLEKGDTVGDLDPRIAHGLFHEGFIAEAKMAKPVENKMALPVENKDDIPANWRDLTWSELRSLGATVSATAVRNKADAIAAIEKYLDD